ncbi:tetratricopeptide repeat protein [Chromobacterium vaccinii]|uniref:tetratricopeptide repeat protein n=1 Tax=Chromobacterium vaccinii TaxID=1108595 RepID=UPI003C726852
MNTISTFPSLFRPARLASLLCALALAPQFPAQAAETPASQALAPQAAAAPLAEQAYQLMMSGQQAKAHELYLQAAAMGNRRALSTLAESYGRNSNGFLKSPSVKKDYPRLLGLLERAARYPEPEGSGYWLQRDYAVLLVTAPASYRDAKRGGQLLEQLMRQHPSIAECYLLGQMHEEGRGFAADGQQAVYWYQKALSADASYAPPYIQRALSRLYRTGAANLPPDAKKAREWADKAKRNPGYQS